MKIRSEYAILSECIDRGINLGWNRAHKHVEDPSEEVIKNAIYDAVTSEITEYFSFEENNGE
jgi:hypothetical protein